jgi:acyl dehydratase
MQPEPSTWTASIGDLAHEGFITSGSLFLLLLATLVVATIVTALFLGIRRVRHPRHGGHVRTRHL